MSKLGPSSTQYEKNKDAYKPMGYPHVHESACAQVSGSAVYVDDIEEIKGTLYAAPIMSKIAHGQIKKINVKPALDSAGVRGVVLSSDIRGDKKFSNFVHDEPIFAIDHVHHIGQVIGLVVADSVMKARRAARLVECDITPLPHILSVEQALRAKSFVLPPVYLKRGDSEKTIKKANHVVSGQLRVGGQEHFYLEGQVAYAVPLEQSQWLIYSSTQHPGEAQHWVAHALDVELNAVKIECKRMGGAFGGKETQGGHLAVWASLAAYKFNCPVKMRLDRDEDFLITGKRHPFSYKYRVGFNDQGLLQGLDLVMASNCGFSADLSGPVADRAVFHVDNAYFLEDVSIASFRCKTNTQSHTAFRGFGGPQGMIVIEHIMGEIARKLGLDPLEVRHTNLYQHHLRGDRCVTHYQMRIEDNILEPLLKTLASTSNYSERRKEIFQWNNRNALIKRGISITPVKFGISFTATLFNQAGALVNVYTDGSVQVNHGGTEMGQGLNTKVAQIVAGELGLTLDKIRVTATDTSKIPNASATAASSGFDLNGRAAQFAARQIKTNLAAFVSGLDQCGAGAVSFENSKIITPKSQRPFKEVVELAYANRIQLWSDGFYRTPKIHYDKTTLTGRPFYYFTYGAACTEVAIDTLTGECRVLRVDILQDVGKSINPAIDQGQIEGGFIQGMGWLTNEELVWNSEGYLSTHAPSTYKIPSIGDTPDHFVINLWTEPNCEDNVFSSKAVGEPPFMLAISVFEAIKEAISAAREDLMLDSKQIDLVAPATPENILKALRDTDF
jgi:xanthine dehydrogenase large subunit